VYHDTLLESNSQSKFDCLRRLYTLDMTEDGKDRSWECTKELKYCEEKGLKSYTSYNCLVEWNDMNKSQSWMNFFDLGLPIPHLSFDIQGKMSIWIRCHFVISYNIASLNH
jgi:hypothetical protein